MSRCTISTLALSVVFALSATSAHAVAAAKVKGLGDPGSLKSIEIAPLGKKQSIEIRGRDARQQLFVTGKYSTGQTRDLTRGVKYTSSPAGVVNIDGTGLVTPVKDGSASIIATSPKGKTTKIAVHVQGFANPMPINFNNQIVPHDAF